MLADPEAEIRRLCSVLEYAWDQPLEGKLPHSAHTLTPPAPDKWRRHEQEIEKVLPALAPLIARAEDFCAR